MTRGRFRSGQIGDAFRRAAERSRCPGSRGIEAGDVGGVTEGVARHIARARRRRLRNWLQRCRVGDNDGGSADQEARTGLLAVLLARSLGARVRRADRQPLSGLRRSGRQGLADRLPDGARFSTWRRGSNSPAAARSRSISSGASTARPAISSQSPPVTCAGTASRATLGFVTPGEADPRRRELYLSTRAHPCRPRRSCGR